MNTISDECAKKCYFYAIIYVIIAIVSIIVLIFVTEIAKTSKAWILLSCISSVVFIIYIFYLVTIGDEKAIKYFTIISFWWFVFGLILQAAYVIRVAMA